MDESKRLCCRKTVGRPLEGPERVSSAVQLDMAADVTGEAIQNACVQLLTDLANERNNLTVVATDGTAAKTGSKNGAAKFYPTGLRDLSSSVTMFWT